MGALRKIDSWESRCVGGRRVLTLRLYSNQDAGNILWEYAFDAIAVESTLLGYENQTDSTWYVTADNPTVDFKTTILGYADRDEKTKKLARLSWAATNGASFAQTVQTNDSTGVFDNTLTMPTRKGAVSEINVALAYGSDTATSTKWKNIEVLAGKPQRIELVTTGEPTVFGLGDVRIDAYVYDQHNNLVEDGTSVDFLLEKSLRVKEQQAGTTNGHAYLIATGGEFNADAANITLKSEGVEVIKTVPIRGLNVVLEATDTSLRHGQVAQLTATVTKPDGTPAVGVNVSFNSKKGLMEKRDVTTDATGHATVNYTAGLNPLSDEWVAAVGFTGGDRLNYSVGAQGTSINALDAMLVAEGATAGEITYKENDVDITAGYEVQGTVTLNIASDNTAVTLGDLADPNLEPVLALTMTEVETVDGKNQIADEHGLNPGEASTDITIVRDHPLGAGRSAEFTAASRVRISGKSAFNRADQVGFRLDFKPTGDAPSGMQTFLEHANGTQVLRYESGKLIYQVKTSTDTYTLEANGIAHNQWHRIGARVSGGEMQLLVDDQLLSKPITGSLEYGGNTDIVVGGVQAHMRALRWYDWSKPALIAFEDNNQQQTLAQGSHTLTVKSLGHLGEAMPGSTLKQLRVAITAGERRNYVSLLTKTGYKEIAQQYIGTLSAQSPYAVLYRPNPFPELVPTAYAWSSDGIFEGIKTAVGYVFPYEDFLIVGEQLMYLATGDWDNFKPTQLAFAALGVATVLPPAKILKPFLGPARKFVTAFEKFPAAKHFAGAIGTAVKESVSGKHDKLAGLLPFVMVGMELYEDPEALGFIMSAINSEEDLWTWVEYFATLVEINGGMDILAAANDRDKEAVYADLGIQSWIPYAYAGGTPKYNRKEVAQLILGEIKKLAKSVDNPKKFSEDLRTLLKLLKENAPELKTFLNTKTFIGAMAGIAKYGKDKLEAFIKDSKHWRVNRFIVLFSIMYTLEEIEAGTLTLDPKGKAESLEKYAFLLADVFSSRPWIKHGAIFQLSQIAYYQLMNQYAGGSKVLGIEQLRPAFKVVKIGGEVKPDGKSYGRKIDIVLDDNGGERWVELKSLRNPFSSAWFKNTTERIEKTKGSFFASDEGARNYYRQFFHDMRTNKDFIKQANLRIILPPKALPNSSFIWYFQEFKDKPSSPGPKNSDIESARVGLCQSSQENEEFYSQNLKDGKSMTHANCGRKSGSYIQLRNSTAYLKEVLAEHAKDLGIEDFIELAKSFDDWE